MVKPGVIVFDMDGVLVDVRASYRDCIVAAVDELGGGAVTHEEIQDYKNRGGFNNDWLLTQTVCADRGVAIDYQTVVQQFNKLFFGEYMQREKWLPAAGLLARLAATYTLYIFTGRLNEEAQMTLRRFDAVAYFTKVYGDDDVRNPKPAPDGLIAIGGLHPGATLLYLGDTVDDRRSAEAAGVAFLGVGPHSGAAQAIDEINQLEGWIG